MTLQIGAQLGGNKLVHGYLAILVCLIVLQPLFSDEILFYGFACLAFLSCFLPQSVPFSIFLSLCVVLLFLVDIHSPYKSTEMYIITAIAGLLLVLFRLVLGSSTKKDLKASKAQFEAFWQTIVDGLVVIDDQATIVAVNPAVEQLFGYKSSELIGQNVKVLMPHRYAVEHDGYVSAYNTTGRAKIIGTGREVEGLRKDGTTFPMYLAVSKFEDSRQRYYCGIVRDMSLENEIRANLVEARDRAESASYAKTKFLSSISHEVRTPLNAILGFSQLLEATLENGASPEQKDYMEHIQSSGEHLLALINEVLDMSQIESGNLQLSIERVNAENVLQECLSMVEPIAKKYEVSLLSNSELPTGVAVRADRVRLKQAIINLGTNAIKYNRRGGQASWRIFMPDEDTVRFEVTDTGFGIAEEQRESLFEPFNRLGREASTIEGTGIGLSVTKTVIEAMDGSVDFKSTEGMGTTFWIDLPVSVLGDSDMDDYEAPDEMVQIRYEDDGFQATILYVEDNPANTVLMQRFMSKLKGIRLLHAKTAEIGMQMVREQQIDLILMDLNLPGMDGFEAQMQLAKDERTKNIPVVAVSADVNPKTIQRAMNVGFKKFISKPFNLREAQQTIESVLPEDRRQMH